MDSFGALTIVQASATNPRPAIRRVDGTLVYVEDVEVVIALYVLYYSMLALNEFIVKLVVAVPGMLYVYYK